MDFSLSDFDLGWYCQKCKRRIIYHLDMAASTEFSMETAVMPAREYARFCFLCTEEVLDFMGVSRGDNLDDYAEHVKEIAEGIVEEMEDNRGSG